jgi:hypothetical protein
MNGRTNIPAHICKLRGTMRLRLGEKPVTQELLEDRAWEKAHDEEKYRRWKARLRRHESSKRRKGSDA